MSIVLAPSSEPMGLGLQALWPRDWPEKWVAYGNQHFRFGPRSEAPRPLEVVYRGEHPATGSEPILLYTDDGLHLRAPGVYAHWYREGNVLEVRGSSVTPSVSLNNAMRLWMSYILPGACDGLMIHAASCVACEDGIILAGLSGAGKSTFVSGLRRTSYLSDDISMVDKVSSSPRLLPSPFFGALGRQGSDIDAPLRAIAILQQGQTTTIDRISVPEAAGHLLRHVVFFPSDRASYVGVLDRVASLVSRVPVYLLRRSLADDPDTVCRLLLDSGRHT